LSSGSRRQKRIHITDHAVKRILRYGLTKRQVLYALRHPDEIIVGYKGRKVAHKFKNEYVIRIIFEENEFITVVTVYLSRRERYVSK